MPIVYNPLFLPNQCTTYIIDEGIYASRNSAASSVRLGKNKEEFFSSVTRSPARHDAQQGFCLVQQAPTQEVVPNAVSRAVAMEAMI